MLIVGFYFDLFMLGISLHNFPEGMAVFLGSIKVPLLLIIVFPSLIFFQDPKVHD